MIEIIIENTNVRLEVPYGTSLEEIIKSQNIQLQYPILGALVNNKVHEISFRVNKPCIISFFDITSKHGSAMYSRSAHMMLYKAVRDTLPKNVILNILHSVQGGTYCEFSNLDRPLDQALVDTLTKRMEELVAEDLPFERKVMLTSEALETFRKQGLEDKIELLRHRNTLYTTVFALGDTINYIFGILAPSTRYINFFKIELFEEGLLMKVPTDKRPNELLTTMKAPKLFGVFHDFKKWANAIGVPYVYDLNNRIAEGKVQDTILITEAYHEKILANLADDIHKRQSKMVLISGPSSSGKTSTCKRLSVQLSILGYDPVQISVDDFFLNRDQTPKDENGELDFETIDALDIPLLNNTLQQLIDGKEVPMPTFNFQKGIKEWKGNSIKLKENSIMVVEGIHCLNPKLTSQIDDSIKFRLFVSALTSISIDHQNPISTIDNRLLRRIIRDYNYRGYSAQDTISRWPSVRRGEEKYIIPFQIYADALFNTSLICELGVLKPYATSILSDVPENCPEYPEAYRLLKFLSYFKTIPTDAIPGTSILREFVGGSKFTY